VYCIISGRNRWRLYEFGVVFIPLLLLMTTLLVSTIESATGEDDAEAMIVVIEKALNWKRNIMLQTLH